MGWLPREAAPLRERNTLLWGETSRAERGFGRSGSGAGGLGARRFAHLRHRAFCVPNCFDGLRAYHDPQYSERSAARDELMLLDGAEDLASYELGGLDAEPKEPPAFRS